MTDESGTDSHGAYIQFEGYDIWIELNQFGDVSRVVAPSGMPKEVLERLKQQWREVVLHWLRGEGEVKP